MGFCLPAPVIAQQTLQGLQYFRLLGPLFDHLHRVGTARDRAGNRHCSMISTCNGSISYAPRRENTGLRGRTLWLLHAFGDVVRCSRAGVSL
jgi:hypothetical protein